MVLYKKNFINTTAFVKNKSIRLLGSMGYRKTETTYMV